MTPLTGVLQWHFAPAGFIDPYIGAGAAYVLFDNVNGYGNLGVDKINFKDDVSSSNACLIRHAPRIYGRYNDTIRLFQSQTFCNLRR